MKSDVQIALETELSPIEEVAKSIGLKREDLFFYGNVMAKITAEAVKRATREKRGKLILVTAINPTPAGEGKTTTNIGLSMALHKLGKKTVTTLREPSLGPVFGIKGGAAGGGYSQVLPMENINLHFTGDFHGITSAHNLISAAIDNHIHQGNALGIDSRRVLWKRVLDMNDRALRNIVVGLGGKTNGFPREDGFDITVASEIMAILCLSEDLQDLKARIGRIIVAYNREGEPVYVRDLEVQGACTLLLKDALLPNLVQTTEQTPAIVHGGPFANIAHGCNSVLATKTALGLGDYVVTEAGFGADLGAEKFMDIKCPLAGLSPDAVVVVATIRALKYHGGVSKENLEIADVKALEKGFVNLKRHLENMDTYGVPKVVAINRFPTDTEEEIAVLDELCKEIGVSVYLSEVWAKGSDGAMDLARKVVELCEEKNSFHPIYDEKDDVVEKIKKVATKIYGASEVEFTRKALESLEEIRILGKENLPVCMAKTQYSFSDDPEKLGAPEGFTLHVREVDLKNGAGFIVVKTGDIMTMPGLPKVPAANHMDIEENGEITGLF